LVTRASAENDAAANAVAIVTPSDARRAHLQLELGNIAVSSYDALEAVPLRLGSFPRATMAAEIRYGEMRECGGDASNISNATTELAGARQMATRKAAWRWTHARRLDYSALWKPLLIRRVFCIRLRASRVHIVPRLYANYS